MAHRHHGKVEREKGFQVMELIEKDIIRARLDELMGFVLLEIRNRARKARAEGRADDENHTICPEDDAFLEGAALAGTVIAEIHACLDGGECDDDDV